MFLGCIHNCKGCHNPETHNFKYGKELTKDYKEEIIGKIINNHVIDGVTFSGGDPLALQNRFEVYNLIYEIKQKRDDLNIWIYTGYTYEKLLDEMNIQSKAVAQMIHNILYNIDVLVDGPFIEEKKDLNLQFRGSSNQRIINIKESLKQNKIVLLEL